jgi:phage terminase small subunit
MADGQADNKPKLNQRQLEFIEKYLACNNAAKAAREAGYSEKTADRIGYQNLRKLEIQQEIERRQKERLEKLKMKADEVLIELSILAKSDFKDYAVSTKQGGFRFKSFEEMPAHATKAIRKIKQKTRRIVVNNNGMDTEIDEGSAEDHSSYELESTIEIELYDKYKGLVALGNHFGLFEDADDHDAPPPDGDPLEKTIKESVKLAWSDMAKEGDNDGA